VDPGLLATMTDSLVHRGPDGRGQAVLGNVGFGHRRLAILDLSDAGAQPLADPRREIWVTYNGEIYNWRALRAELEAAGHVFRSQCDTEVLVHGFREWDTGLFARLSGMFALAIHDARDGRVVLARDRLGIKPLYTARAGDDWLFASEVRALLASGRVTAAPEPELVDAYLTLGYVPGERTFFRGVHKLRPAHYLVIDGTAHTEHRYWDPADVEPVEQSYETSKAQLKDRLAATIESHLMSDVPLGCFLSGGVDSSGTVAFLVRELGRDVATFTVGYPEDRSELGHAERVAKLYGTDHHAFELTHEDFLVGIDRQLEHAEEPLVESAAVALLELSRITKPHATVMLSGEGADEVFAGYPLYARNRQLDTLRNWLFPLRSAGVRGALRPLLRTERLRKYLDWIGLPLDRRHHGNSCDVTPSLRPAMYAAGGPTGDFVEAHFQALFAKVAHRDPVARMQTADLQTWLVDDLLLKADKMTMAASLELRVPFLDHEMVEFGLSLPADHKLRNGVGKAVLKDLLREYLPEDLLYRTKQGFPVPVSRWFREGLHDRVRTLLLDERTLDRGYLRREYVRNALDRHLAGREDLGRRLFALVVLELWHRRWVEGEVGAAAALQPA
jgi:asparagine synthase (glutamine-hydrolysing)